MYGRLCIKFPQSRMKGEQHHAWPTEPLVYTTTQWLWSLLMGLFSVCKHNGYGHYLCSLSVNTMVMVITYVLCL
jgi:hypothetical protein